MFYSLKHLPDCYPRPVTPKKTRWIAVLVAMLVISMILMRIFGRYIDNNHFWLVAIGTPVVVWIVPFGFRMWIWSLQDSKANGFDWRREQWILSETRRARRALQVLNTTFITAHQEDEQRSVADDMLNNHSIIISQSDWKGEKSRRLSLITAEPEDTPGLVISRLFSELIADLPVHQGGFFIACFKGKVLKTMDSDLPGNTDDDEKIEEVTKGINGADKGIRERKISTKKAKGLIDDQV